MLPPEISEWAYSEEEMAAILRIKRSTLKQRIATGTNHPPIQEWVRGEVIFPKLEFAVWAKKKPILYEVRSAS